MLQSRALQMHCFRPVVRHHGRACLKGEKKKRSDREGERGKGERGQSGPRREGLCDLSYHNFGGHF